MEEAKKSALLNVSAMVAAVGAPLCRTLLVAAALSLRAAEQAPEPEA